MVGLAQEHDSAIGLVIDGHRKLERLDPDNDLLKYAEVSDEGVSYTRDKGIIEKFLDAFAPETRCPTAVMLARYYVALRDAADAIEGIERPSPTGS